MQDLHNHLAAFFNCNNNCVHCMERDPSGKGLELAAARLKKDFSLSQLKALLEKKALIAGAPVVFTGGEPTLNPGLPAMAGLLRRSGFRDIALQTNGRMLCYKDFCLQLIKAGIGRFGISIHGSSAKTHEAITRTRGSFRQTIAGIENLLELKKTLPRLTITTHTTPTRLNISDLEPMLALFSGWKVNTIVINPLCFKGNAVKYSRQLFLPYCAIARELKKAIAGIRRRRTIHLPRISITDFPLCVTAGLTEHAGVFERVALLSPDAKASLLDQKLGFAGAKRKQCRACRHFNACTGISPFYIKEFGWEEFVPCTESV